MRRAGRLNAVQALYQMDVGGMQSNTVIREFLNHRFGQDQDADIIDVDTEFFEDVVKGVVAFQTDIDTEISLHLSKKWNLKRLDKTLRAIIRAAVYEIMRRPDVPALVIIDQYVSISSDFFDAKESGFINGILEKIAKKIRAAEFGLIGGAIAVNIAQPED